MLEGEKEPPRYSYQCPICGRIRLTAALIVEKEENYLVHTDDYKPWPNVTRGFSFDFQAWCRICGSYLGDPKFPKEFCAHLGGKDIFKDEITTKTT